MAHEACCRPFSSSKKKNKKTKMTENSAWPACCTLQTVILIILKFLYSAKISPWTQRPKTWLSLYSPRSLEKRIIEPHEFDAIMAESENGRNMAAVAHENLKIQRTALPLKYLRVKPLKSFKSSNEASNY